MDDGFALLDIPKFRQAVTAERMREVLDYDPQAGVFQWKARKNCPGFACSGKVAGTPVRGRVSIGIDHIIYPAHRLAWLYVHGCWPDGKLVHKNRVRGDNRIDNLCAARTGPRPSQSKYGFKGVRGPAATKALANAFAERLRPLFEGDLAGLSATAAAQELDRRGVATARGGKWEARSVIAIRARLGETEGTTHVTSN